jgi:TPR repeat protein
VYENLSKEQFYKAFYYIQDALELHHNDHPPTLQRLVFMVHAWCGVDDTVWGFKLLRRVMDRVGYGEDDSIAPWFLRLHIKERHMMTQHVVDAAIRYLTTPSDRNATILALATKYVQDFCLFFLGWCESSEAEALKYDISKLAKVARGQPLNELYTVMQSSDIQLKIVTMAATLFNCPESAYWLVIRLQNNYNYSTTNQKKTFFNWLKQAAEQGHAKAQFELARCYDDGHGVDKNSETAVEWYTKAAEQGHARSQLYLGFCYKKGQGVAKNMETAVKWYTKASKQGSADAQYNLTVCYMYGQGVSQNWETTVGLAIKAAEQGHSKAQYTTGVCYEQGQGVGKNLGKAIAWYTKAAEQGNSQAQFKLGYCYENGHSVTINCETSVKWYTKAAIQGHIQAQYRLGICYNTGKGVAQNSETAVEWFTKAAIQGNAEHSHRIPIWR